MPADQYQLVTAVGNFTAGAVLDVTARFGDWHVYDVRLEPVHQTATGSLELTAERLETVARPVSAETESAEA
jgi:hypothetical protein